MRFEKIPYYLRHSIETIISDARKNITVHYTEHKNQSGSRFGTGCQIIDHNDYSLYFYEPGKFEIIEPKVIKCLDQRSAHQNWVIALKKWESEIREFLSKPWRKMDIYEKTETKKGDLEKNLGHHPTSTIQIQEVLSSASREQKILRGRRVVIR